ncbi:hypothetical protein [Methylophilus sp. TWE2]|uniref:hypothetical protein n=1 Tax=Methylophilus sp. TWE2 TaxID=1662285 RepID=UPI0006712177|nr:hypothetical protein [Methylophilus sp. TWE2]AKR43483.1 hypothetical protein ACJ67_08640 [Methylophilus sp. TWE2]
MMKITKQRISRAIWTFKQPLTKQPSIAGSPVSDLFLWRCNRDWETFFELIDISAMFGARQPVPNVAKIMFFDAAGIMLRIKEIELIPNQRKTLKISDFLSENDGEVGTFCVFHMVTPDVISHLGSFLAERGYVSYQYRDAPLRSYVHGNLDAVSLNGSRLEMLGGCSWLKRRYALQYQFIPNNDYELAIANPTDKKQHIKLTLFDMDNKQVFVDDAHIAPGGVHLTAFDKLQSSPTLLSVESKMIMARPSIFKIKNDVLDVFHG